MIGAHWGANGAGDRFHSSARGYVTRVMRKLLRFPSRTSFRSRDVVVGRLRAYQRVPRKGWCGDAADRRHALAPRRAILTIGSRR